MIEIWCDTRRDVGLGHLVRCLALAMWAERRGAEVAFLINERWPGVEAFLARYAFPHRVGAEPEIAASRAEHLVADGYELDLSVLESHAARTLLIDDLGVRDAAVDLVVNPNVYAPELRYPRARAALLGADYALLRPEFADLRASRNEPRAEISRVFVMIGGSDVTGETPRVLEGLQGAGFAGVVDVVTARDDVETNGWGFEVIVHRSTPRVAEIMAAADLAICGAGGSTWELACLGVPAIQVVVADNQRKIGAWLRQNDVATVLDAPVNTRELARAVAALTPLSGRAERAARGRSVVDGLGASRVLDELL